MTDYSLQIFALTVVVGLFSLEICNKLNSILEELRKM